MTQYKPLKFFARQNHLTVNIVLHHNKFK